MRSPKTAISPATGGNAHGTTSVPLVAAFVLCAGLLLAATRAFAAAPPSPWVDADIGSPGVAGSASYSSGTFTIIGGGADIWGTSDQFNYCYQAVSGDFTITARVASQTNSDGWAKAGVMVRQYATGNNAAGAAFVMTVVTPSNGIDQQYRDSQGAGAGLGSSIAGTAPYWVRLVRSGSTFTSSCSTNGTAWTQINSHSTTLTDPICIGLEVTSHNNSTTSTATFDNVSVSAQGVTATPVISATNNNLVPSTVTLSDATAGSSIYYTTDGSTPTTGSTLYSAPFVISSACTLQAIATAPGYNVSSVASAVFIAPRPPDNPTGTQPGLVYQFYLAAGAGGVLPDFTQLTPSKSGTVTNFDLSPRTQDTTFSFQYLGYVTVPTTGTWTFYTSSDDGSRLYIGNTLVVDNNYSQGQTERSGTILLQAGTHAITVQFAQGGGGFGLAVSYASTGTAYQAIPNAALSYLPPTSVPTISATNSYIVPSTVTITDATAGSTIHYTTDGSTPTKTHGTTYTGSFVISSPCTLQAIATATGYADSFIASAAFFVPLPAETPAGTVQGVKYKFYTSMDGSGVLPDFTTITPAKTGSINNFLLDPRTTDTNISFEYTGYVTVPATGMWTFYTTSDDGSRLFIGPSSTLVVDNNYAQGMTERSGTIALASGMHSIKVQWVQGGGGFGLEVRYQGPSGSGIAKQQIPDSALSYIPLTATPVILWNGTATSSLTVKIPIPTFSLSLSCATPNSTIYYTTNGTVPTTASPVYSTPVNLSIPVTVEAMATSPNHDSSVIAVANFVTSNPPPNDNFASAIVLSGALPIAVTGTNLNATWENGEPNHGAGGGQKSIWYSWVAPSSGSYQLSSLGSTASDGNEMDTALAVYTGSAVSALTLLVQNDDANTSTKTSLVVFPAVAGTTYRIAVDGYDGIEGNVRLTLSQGSTVSVVATVPNASETGPVNGVFTITRTAPYTGNLVVYYTFSGTADAGQDFLKFLDDFVTIPNGSASTTLTITPTSQFNIEAAETVIINLTPSPSFALDPAHTSATVTIAAHGGAGSGTVAALIISYQRGFYTAPVDISITTSTSGASINYTLDGTMPTPTYGTLYTAPIHITGTTTLRAIGYKTGMSPCLVATQTYIYTAGVVAQSPNGETPAGWPSSWGSNVVDYGMDPTIVNNATWSSQIQPGLKSIRSFCVSIKLADLFDSSTGIYANPYNDTYVWERPCSLEMIDPNNSSNSWGSLCGIRIRGGFSRSTGNPKHAFRIFFRKQYDKGSLSQPVFGPPPAAQKFDKFDIRCDQNYSWSFGGDKGNECFIRDQWSADSQLAISGIGPRNDYYHLYINGEYWGLFNTDERPEESFAANYFGGNKDDYDVIKTSGDTGYSIYATNGNLEAWTRLWKQCKAGLSSNAAYFKIQGRNPDGTPNAAFENLLELDEMIDYMLIMYYGGNLDAPISAFLGNASPNNIFFSRSRFGMAGFRFFPHDSEHTLLNVNENRLGPFTAGDTLDKSNPQWIFQQCMANAEFRMKVADHIRKHFFDGGALTPGPAAARFTARMNQLNAAGASAVLGESARWGNSKTSPAATYTDWWNACQNVLNNFFPGRTAVVLSQFQAVNLYPSLGAPTFNRYGGAITPPFTCVVTNPNATGRVYYTTDGSDPRKLGGTLAPSAVAGSTTTTNVVLNGATTLRTRVLNGSTWSAMTEATFSAPQDFSTLHVTEVMYHPAAFGNIDGDQLEFIELKNTGSVALNLTGANFTMPGILYTFPSGSVVNPGQYVVLVANPQDFGLRYPAYIPYGTFLNHLGNAGDTLTLLDGGGSTMFSFSFGAAAPWPTTPDGGGYSLVPADPLAPANSSTYGTPTYWRASTNPGGSPGEDDPTGVQVNVLVNEALTHVDAPAHQYVELYNAAGATADVSGWYLTDDHTSQKKFRIPDGTTIETGGYVAFDDTSFGASFTLNPQGGEVYVFAADPVSGNLTGYSHGFSFGAGEKPVAFGRYVISTGAAHFVAQISNSREALNSGPRVGPIVFNEVMYHPAGAGDQYIELLNITPSPVNLYDPANPTNTWKITGVNFTFPQNAQVPANGLAVISGMAPATFRTKYNVPAGVPVFGPWGTVLNTTGMHLELQKPDAPAGTVPYIVVEALDYASTAPWPLEPAGTGPSLARINPLSYGNDPANWLKSPANGGSPGLNDTPAGPTNLSAAAQSSAVINLSWSDNATNETSYTIERSPDGVSGWVALPTLGANVTSFQDSGLSPVSTYYYCVYASNQNGNSLLSNVASATTPAPPPPSTPTDLIVLPVSQSKLDIAWGDASDNETGFKIERSLDGQTGWTEITQTVANATEYVDYALQPLTRYYYRVRAFNTYGNSDYVGVSNAQTLQDRILSIRAATPLMRGHKGSVFVDLNSVGGENSVAFSLAFDPLVLSNPVVSVGTGAGSGVTLSQQNSPGAVGATLVWSSSGTYATGVKNLVEIRFDVAASGAATSTPLTFGDQPVARRATDVNLLALETNYQGGTASIIPNHPPVASNGTLTLLEDTPQSGTLSASDADGDPLAFSIVAPAAKGLATITDPATGAFTYTPNANANGQDSFTFKANDGAVDSNVGTIWVSITPVNDPPVAANASFSTLEDAPHSGTLPASDADLDPLTYSIVADPVKGVVAITNTATGAFTYTPNAAAIGPDSFTFKANDGLADSNVATVSITIALVNRPPVAANGLFTTPQDMPYSGTLAASDVDLNPLTFSIVAAPAHGGAAITDTSTGAFTYTPNAGWNGADSFTFKANDGLADSNVATVSITISTRPALPMTVVTSLTIPKSIWLSWGGGTTGKQAGDVTALTWTVRNASGNRVGLGQTFASNDSSNNMAILLQNSSETTTNARVSAAVADNGGWNIGGSAGTDTVTIKARLGTQVQETLAASAQELTSIAPLAKGANQALVLTVMTPTSVTNSANLGVQKTISVALTASPE